MTILIFVAIVCGLGLLFYRIHEQSQKIYDLEKEIRKEISLSYDLERMIVENAQDIQRCKNKIDLLETKNGSIESKNSEPA